MGTLQQIFSQVEKAEVLLTFNVDSLITYLSDTARFRIKLKQMGLEQYVDWQLLTEVAKAANPNWRAVIQKMLAQGIIEQSGARFGTIFFIRPNGSTPWSYWLIHLSSVFKARDVMMNIHWEHANDFTHHLEPDLFTLGYGASHDPEATHQQLMEFGDEFTFDAEAERKCLDGLTEKLTRTLFDSGRAVTFQQLLNELGNNTPATAEMTRRALHQPVSSNDIEVIGEDGDRRKKGNTIRLTDTILPGKVRPIFLFNNRKIGGDK